MREAEVCIIGAGAAGGILALELARQGVSVVVLERGPRHPPEDRARMAGAWADGGPDPWRAWLEQYPGFDAYTTAGEVAYPLAESRVMGVGGSTLHWMGYTPRLNVDDFRMRSRFGVGADWPIQYDELEPYYVRAEASLGVAGADDDPFAAPRSAPYPLPPFEFSSSDRLFMAACQGLDLPVHHKPQARASRAYQGRPPCTACAICRACPIGAKTSTDLLHIPLAEATGNVRVVPEVTVLRLESAGGRVTGAVYAGLDRVEHRQEAQIFVVAGGGIETARLLLLSAGPGWPEGLANRSGAVGRYFNDHVIAHSGARYRDVVYNGRVGFETAHVTRFAVGPDRDRRGGYVLGFSNGPDFARVDGSLRRLRHRGRGDLLAQALADEWGPQVEIGAMIEQLPDERNTVTLDPDVRDWFGLPAPRITYGFSAYEHAGIEAANAMQTAIFEAMGCTGIEHRPPRYGFHHMGTCRMGDDPATSVVDRDLRCHGVDNLLLVSSGAFPTGGVANPTLTIGAFAIRAADHLLATRDR